NRVRAPASWGSITCLVSPASDILLAGWENLNGLVRLRCPEGYLCDTDAELEHLLSAGQADLLQGNSPVAAMCTVPESAEVIVALTNRSLALVPAEGGLQPLVGLTGFDPLAGPPMFLRILEPGWLLARQLSSPVLRSAQLHTAQDGRMAVSGWRTFQCFDGTATDDPPVIQACAAGCGPGVAIVAFRCQSRNRIAIVKLGPDAKIHPVLTDFMCHTRPIRVISLLTSDLTGALPLLATASAQGKVSIWRMQSGTNRLAEVSHFEHGHEVTTLGLHLTATDRPLLLVGDAGGNTFSLELPWLDANAFHQTAF
uniref:WD_REPEATS_REGION domain-containing protein n=1 Tax=Macrostomum lignano TaxID=282301 RepID=A0A1I8G7W2_9PLAT